MFVGTPVITKRKTAFCVYGGSGFGALGLQWADAKFGDTWGGFEILGSVDVDPRATEDFTALTNTPATTLDLFDRQQYVDWHGKEPPADWQEATCDELKAAAQNRDPDLVLVTAPCKGLSGLLSQDKSDSRKYQALNRLTYRGVFMVLETWKHNPPGLILFENVPRISTRGKAFLNDIKRLLLAYGYVLDERHHDLGPIGGLGQHRKRYLLVARNPQKVSSFLYYPPKLRMKSIGEVMEQQIPWMPDAPAAGPMHRLPRLQWKTWVRLALIPPGGDWRNLQNIKPGQYRITVEQNGQHTSKYRVYDSTLPAGTVTGSDRLGSGAPSVADYRLSDDPNRRSLKYHIQDTDDPANTIIGQTDVQVGAPLMADPRIGHTPMGNGKGAFWVQDSSDPSGTVTADPGHRKSGGASVFADPRMLRHASEYGNMLPVRDWDQPTNTVTGASGPNQGANLVADPRLGCAPRSGTMGVSDWSEPGATVLGAGDVHAGVAAVADPREPISQAETRIPEDHERGVWFIVSPHKDRKGRHCVHRPMTTMELMALQSAPVAKPDGSPVVLAGNSDRAWRERIGNGLPPAAMKAIGEMCLLSLLPGEEGDWVLSPYGTPIWVRPNGQEITLELTD